MARARKLSNWAVLFPFVLPYFLYVGVLAIPETAVPRAWTYGLAFLASAAGIVWGWRWTLALTGPRSPVLSVLAGIAGGVLGTVLWVAIKAPFYDAGGEADPPAEFWARLVASATVVAVFEEKLFRGFILLGAVQWDQARRSGSKDPLGHALHDSSIRDLAPGAWTPAALAISTIAFASGHAPGEWPAALAYGLLMAGLWIWRKDLLSCVVAHATTNATLALWVRHSGQWDLW